jgi:hypothetical protein
MERIGDHVNGIAHVVTQMDDNKEENRDIIELGVLAQKLFQDSFRSVLDINAELANQVIKVSGVASAMGNRITRKSELSDNTFYLHHERQRKIVESFQRIAEYSADIAEMVINMKATEIKDSLSGDAQVLEQA